MFGFALPWQPINENVRAGARRQLTTGIESFAIDRLEHAVVLRPLTVSGLEKGASTPP